VVPIAVIAATRAEVWIAAIHSYSIADTRLIGMVNVAAADRLRAEAIQLAFCFPVRLP
jgi:hypothetical protein